MTNTTLSRIFLTVVSVLLFLWLASDSFAQARPDPGWPNYGNDGSGTRYSLATQIDRTNVTQLKAAWTYRTGALPHDEELDKKAAFEATPILADGKLFLSTPYDHVIALNPETGAKLWEHYFGGFRKGDNKWANSVVALRASTGEFVWGFQVVHHDIWDYDVASQPALFAWKDGTPAIAITTKMGRVFVLNRLTGAPLLPVEERPVPKSDIAGEESWPTQPASTISLVPEKLSPQDAWRDAQEKQWCADKIKATRSGEIFTPPSLQGTLVFPSNVGGVNWGSAAYDPQSHLLFMDTNRLPIFVRLIPRAEFEDARKNASDSDRLHGEFARQTGAPYGMFRTPLLAPSGLPCNAPPWGTVAAVDLFSGEKVWDVPLGSWIPGMNTGAITLGGPMVSAGGLVFTAAAMDNYLRAFDSETGKELWKFELPAGGQATPMTYTLKGRQFLVTAAGGHGKLGTKQGDYVIAFTLP